MCLLAEGDLLQVSLCLTEHVEISFKLPALILECLLTEMLTNIQLVETVLVYLDTLIFYFPVYFLQKNISTQKGLFFS